MEITGEYWRSERCGLLLEKPCCSTLGLARYLLWSVYDVRLIIVQTASAQFAKKRSRSRLLEDTLFQKVAFMFQCVQIISKCGQVCYLTKKFHRPSCSSVKQMKESNKKSSSESRDALIAAGYDPCKKCNP